MRNLFFIFIGILCYSCSTPRTDQILVPKLEANFYNKALERISRELKSDPKNQKLVDQKLYYCEQLEWPTTCISALDTYKSQNGMTNQLVEQYIIYYTLHQRYQPLIDIIEKWSKEYDLKERFHKPLIEAFVKSGVEDRASIELRSYMIERSSLEDVVFASKQFLDLKDTLMSTYYLGKVSKLDPKNELMLEYGKILISLNLKDKGFEVLDKLTYSHEADKDFDLMLARLYSDESNYRKARNLLLPYTSEDTISYLVADWYLKDQMWDSAIFKMNELIDQDSTNTKAIWRKARIYENRGWLATSLTHFNSILKIQSGDTISINRIDLIQRKIAYLQRKKFEENKIQIREIEPIKINK